jgi:L-threonylcarbamoyladenylate synthase
VIVFDSINDARVVKLLKSGKVGVIPTDTIYGLATLASIEEGVSRIYSLKKREKKLGTFIAADVEQLLTLGLDEQVLRAVAHLWPNPISVVVPVVDGRSYLDMGKGSLAVRIPRNDTLLGLLQETGPLATTSANLFDQPPSSTIADAHAYFGDRVDFYVDAGELSPHPPSTIIRLEGGRLEVLRQGAIMIDERGNIV